MKTSNILLIVTITTFIGIYTADILKRGNSHKKTNEINLENYESLELYNFNTLTVDGNVDLTLEQSDTFNVWLQKSELTSNLKSNIFIQDKALSVNFAHIETEDPIYMYVSLPELEFLSIASKGEVKLKYFESDSLKINLDQSTIYLQKAKLSSLELKASNNSQARINNCSLQHLDIFASDSSKVTTYKGVIGILNGELHRASKLNTHSEIKNFEVKTDRTSRISQRGLPKDE